MAFELKDNSISLLKNGFKKDGDNKPDYTGSAKVDGVDMKAALWVNKTKDGKTQLRGNFQKKDDAPF